ncbi:hypothetical protein DL89DRAFT_270171 [Linderina pennispora]|uniref:Uncharacterized protein n=1 Tax=Linderina pennispora TaxID=61395 RepID=A0A1Y1W066_9FUNG|nr:uncharacterized protein DL89DRAFT_270171 [Linderina pennispora]ORX66646.1 hypothetical protein DL89DRAFT_270171 [Linderina pennispora]
MPILGRHIAMSAGRDSWCSSAGDYQHFLSDTIISLKMVFHTNAARNLTCLCFE